MPEARPYIRTNRPIGRVRTGRAGARPSSVDVRGRRPAGTRALQGESAGTRLRSVGFSLRQGCG